MRALNRFGLMAFALGAGSLLAWAPAAAADEDPSPSATRSDTPVRAVPPRRDSDKAPAADRAPRAIKVEPVAAQARPVGSLLRALVGNGTPEHPNAGLHVVAA